MPFLSNSDHNSLAFACAFTRVHFATCFVANIFEWLNFAVYMLRYKTVSRVWRGNFVKTQGIDYGGGVEHKFSEVELKLGSDLRKIFPRQLSKEIKKYFVGSAWELILPESRIPNYSNSCFTNSLRHWLTALVEVPYYTFILYSTV